MQRDLERIYDSTWVCGVTSVQCILDAVLPITSVVGNIYLDHLPQEEYIQGAGRLTHVQRRPSVIRQSVVAE